MSTRQVNLVPGEYYHIYNRGNSKQIIFKSKPDYRRFVDLLYIANTSQQIRLRDYDNKDVFDADIEDPLVHIGAYCLMPNHFHVLITPIEEISTAKFMLKLLTSYAMYFNNKYNRTGSLFEGPFKSEFVDSDRYLKYLFSYIHLNPIKLIQSDWRDVGIHDSKKVHNYLTQYPYSSYMDFLGTKRSHRKILSIDKFPKYFPDEDSFEKEIQDWIKFYDA